VFGLPRSQGQTLERICGFALEVARQLPELSLGIACGSVYAGYVGAEYPRIHCHGRRRKPGRPSHEQGTAREVLCDTYIWQELNSRYEFNYLGALSLRGFVAPVNYYKLARMLPADAGGTADRVVGREERNRDAVRRREQRAGAWPQRRGVCFRRGRGGQSRLIEEVLTRSRRPLFQVRAGCNPILRKPLDAVKRIVQAYFYHNPAFPKKPERMFQGLWGSLAGVTPSLCASSP
jgi:hypothetical protein